jgi:threonine dehydratase
VRIFGVEPEGASTMRQSLDAGHAVHADSVQTIADGLAPPMAGELTYEFVKECVEDVVLVSDDEIVEAMGLLLSHTKLLAEPAGAAATAALLAGRIPLTEGDVVVTVVSGGNIAVGTLTGLLSRKA